MKPTQNSHIRALKAEWLKVRRTGLLWLCFSAAAFIPLINTIAYFFIDINLNERAENFSDIFIQNNFRGFTGFFFPLFLILMVTRIVYIEHRSDTWKLLETQPVSRFAIFIVKWEMAILISLLCLIILFVLSLVGSILLSELRFKKEVQNNAIDWVQFLKLIARLWIASLGMISLQYFLSLVIKNFALPLTIGLIALIGGSILSAFDLFNWFPYNAPSLTSSFLRGSNTGSFLIPHEMMSIVWSLLFLFLAYQLFRYKKIVRAFFKPLPRVATTIFSLLLFSVLFWYINKPVTLPSYGKTILAGKLESDKAAVSKMILFKYPAYDTVLVIPVTNGKFHMQIADKLEECIYIAQAGGSNLQLYFGNADSIHLEWNVSRNNRKQPNITGTRIAENAFLSENRQNYTIRSLAEYASFYSPAQFSSEVLAEWRKGQNGIEKFRTVDNIRPSAEFIELQKKLLAVDLLTLTEITYPRTFAVYNPNDSLKYVPALKQLQDRISLNENNLAIYPSYRQYVSSIVERKRLRTDSSYLWVLTNEVGSERLRNYLAYDVIQKNISVTRDSARRIFMLQQSLSLITEEKLRKNLLDQNDRMNKLQRGRKAPDFIAETINGTELTLENFRNRYVIIDIWATWCAPCKEQDPYFEQLADEFTNEQIAFVSISVDQDKNAWKAQAYHKSKRVLQLWAKNADADFMKGYSVGTIPRFMLIDPKGYILNVQLPFPSEAQFELELQKEIQSLRSTLY